MHIAVILKRREQLPIHPIDINSYDYTGSYTSGLANSAKFVVDMINATGVHTATLVEIETGDQLTQVIAETSPELVIVEALWLPASSIQQAQARYPNLDVIVRIHSEVPFLAGEGIAIQFIKEYMSVPRVKISPNSARMMECLSSFVPKHRLVLLPNFYPIEVGVDVPHQCNMQYAPELNVGCFGAIRNMKNHMLQAMAAMAVADSLNHKLFFHVNSPRLEGESSNNVLKNLRNLFKDTKHVLVEHDWLSRSDFLNLLGTMDVSMQVSLSETFNIVTADAVLMNVPVVVSNEISWVSEEFTCDATDYQDITYTLKKVVQNRHLGKHHVNQKLLAIYAERSRAAWIKTLE